MSIFSEFTLEELSDLKRMMEGWKDCFECHNFYVPPHSKSPLCPDCLHERAQREYVRKYGNTIPTPELPRKRTSGYHDEVMETFEEVTGMRERFSTAYHE